VTRETGRERYWRQVRNLEGELDVDTREARRLWSHHYKKGGGKRKRIALAITATFSGETICPFCRDDIVPEDALSCDRCRTTYHPECWDEFGAVCPTLGCTTRRRASSVRVQVRARMVHATREQRDEWLMRGFWALSIFLTIAFFVVLNLWIHG